MKEREKSKQSKLMLSFNIEANNKASTQSIIITLGTEEAFDFGGVMALLFLSIDRELLRWNDGFGKKFEGCSGSEIKGNDMLDLSMVALYIQEKRPRPFFF